ncbi:hypothetical protein [Burkholderia cepacia]|uniref:hypothetical protein n=1 Tax=Burkholderia cepacia TaxID=292 RepID=UPI002AB77A48|nr:hypothetical protein [Burkholderia cepacia]
MSEPVHSRFVTQQAFLEQAMQLLDMTHEQLARSLGRSVHCVERSLLPHQDPQYRDLEDAEWRQVRELLKAQGALPEMAGSRR